MTVNTLACAKVSVVQLLAGKRNKNQNFLARDTGASCCLTSIQSTHIRFPSKFLSIRTLFYFLTQLQVLLDKKVRRNDFIKMMSSGGYELRLSSVVY